MEQLTPGEWAKEQLKRAPSFAIATAIVAGLLVLSTFIEYSQAHARPRRLDPVEADLADEKPPEIEEIKEQIDPEKPELERAENAPEVEEQDVAPIDAPIDGEVTVDHEFTEDVTSDVTEPSDPFPMSITKRMATIGTNPGRGGFRGVLGNRSKAGKRRAAHRFGMPKGTDKAILAGLRWLKKTQEKDGHWEVTKWGGSKRNARCGVTGLALLAFLGFGCTDKHPREFAKTVRLAMQYLVDHHESEEGGKQGWFGERMYTQGICTMALAEAYAMTGNKPVRRAAQAGLEYILRQQPPYGSFGYTGAGNDVSVTGFQLQAIKSGYVAGLDVPGPAREKAERFLNICMAKDYSTPYRINPSAQVQPQGKVSMTAAALTGRLFMGHKRTARDSQGQADWLIAQDRHLGVANQAGNLYAIYYLSLSMFNMGGRYWKSWNKPFNAALRARQEKDGPDEGSWPTDKTSYGRHGGRVYTTAMACLALEVYFRYLPTYKTMTH